MEQGWEKKKLPDVLWFQEGPGVRKHQYVSEGIKLLNVANLVNGKLDLSTSDRYISIDEAYGKYKHFLVDEGDLILASSGIQVEYIEKKMGFVQKEHLPLCMNTSTIRFKTLNKNVLDIEYFMYFLKSYEFKRQLFSLITGCAQLNYGPSHLKQMVVPVPPIAEQEKIVAELDCLSGIIEKKKQQLKELDNLAQSIFYEMFGDPVENDKGWDIVTLDDVFEIGSSKRVFESQWTDSGVPFYRAREIVKLSKGENIDSPIFISEELYHEYSRKYGVPAEGDMMVTAVGTLGVCYLVKNTDRFYFKDGNTLWFKSRGLCETRFIKDEFATDFIVNQIKGNANAAVVGTYTITNAKKTRVILPPLSLQQEYVRKVQHIDKQKELIAQSIKETETLFNSRMDYYFN